MRFYCFSGLLLAFYPSFAGLLLAFGLSGCICCGCCCAVLVLWLSVWLCAGCWSVPRVIFQCCIFCCSGGVWRRLSVWRGFWSVVLALVLCLFCCWSASVAVFGGLCCVLAGLAVYLVSFGVFSGVLWRLEVFRIPPKIIYLY